MTMLYADFRDRMTDRQLELHSSYEEQAKVTYIDLLSRAKAFRDAEVNLPHENERGVRVVNGCNRAMQLLGQTLYSAAMDLRPYIDRDWVDIETERVGFRLSGFYSRPRPGEFSYIHNCPVEDIPHAV